MTLPTIKRRVQAGSLHHKGVAVVLMLAAATAFAGDMADWKDVPTQYLDGGPPGGGPERGRRSAKSVWVDVKPATAPGK